jgi:hypothetical protein
LPPLLNQAHRNLELLGRATGELSNDGAVTPNITLVRVLSVPRMPGVQTVPMLPPAAEDDLIDAAPDTDDFDPGGSD